MGVGLHPGSVGPGGGGAGLAALYHRGTAETTLSQAHVMGDTEINLASADGVEAGMWIAIRDPRVALEVARVDAVAGSVVTIPAPGLTAARANGLGVQISPLVGAAAWLELPEPSGGAYSHLDVRFLYEFPRVNGGLASSSGRSAGAYMVPQHSWYETLSNRGYWWAGGNRDAGLASYTVGGLNYTGSFTSGASLEYNPTTRRLFFDLIGTTGNTFAPQITNLIVLGR